ncbi:MAG: AraC family transcriptional regulator [Bacterioplanes sp.]|nr:AraC family transcriptional regulator [Bacterioplanes sp.]
MTPHPTSAMTTAVLLPLFELMERKGFACADILSSAGLDDHILNDASQRISIPHFDRLLEQCSKLLNDPHIGLTLGQQLTIERFSMLGFLISGCQTGREVLAILRRYYSLISDAHTPDLFIGNDTVKLVFYVTEGLPFGTRARSELVAAGIHTLAKSLCGDFYHVKEVGLRGTPIGHADKIQRLFAAPVQFNQAHNWISFCGRHLNSPLMYANPERFAQLRQQADQALARFAHLPPFSQRVMHILHEWPESVPITKDAVADMLSTSSRTLTRRLQEENYQFSNLVKEVRLEKAKVSLRLYNADVQQLAIDLGFSDRRGFERAFKQWTGVTPAAYRRQCKNDPSIGSRLQLTG